MFTGPASQIIWKRLLPVITVSPNRITIPPALLFSTITSVLSNQISHAISLFAIYVLLDQKTSMPPSAILLLITCVSLAPSIQIYPAYPITSQFFIVFPVDSIKILLIPPFILCSLQSNVIKSSTISTLSVRLVVKVHTLLPTSQVPIAVQLPPVASS